MNVRAVRESEAKAAIRVPREHWYDAWDRKHEAEQAKTKARTLEFIFLDMASQAVTMDHYDKRKAKYAQQGYL